MDQWYLNVKIWKGCAVDTSRETKRVQLDMYLVGCLGLGLIIERSQYLQRMSEYNLFLPPQKGVM